MEVNKPLPKNKVAKEIKITRHKEIPGQSKFDFCEDISPDEEERRRQLKRRDLLELIHFMEDSIRDAKPFDECVLDMPINEDLSNKGINLEDDPYG